MKSILRQQGTELPFGVLGQLALEHGKHRHRQTLGGFQNNPKTVWLNST